MTTKVTVDAHAGWPVRVTRQYLDKDRGFESREGEAAAIVSAGAIADFNVYDTSRIIVEELTKDVQLTEKVA